MHDCYGRAFYADSVSRLKSLLLLKIVSKSNTKFKKSIYVGNFQRWMHVEAAILKAASWLPKSYYHKLYSYCLC